MRADDVMVAVEAQPEPWCDRRSTRRAGRRRDVLDGTATSVASERSPESCEGPTSIEVTARYCERLRRNRFAAIPR